MTRVRLTLAARCRFPDIGTSHGATTAETGHWISVECGRWLRVEWPGDRTTWLRAEDLESVTDQPEEPNP
jgi:hypothetical protein